MNLMQTAAETWAFGLTKRPDPTPDGCVKHALGLAKLYRETPEATEGTLLMMAACIGHAWNRWPDQIETWTAEYLDQVDSTDQARRSMLYLALGFCPAPIAKTVLESLESNGAVDKSEISQALGLHGVDFTTHVPRDRFQLDLLWGSFFGSGDARYVRQICATILWLADEHRSVHDRDIGKAAHSSIGGYLQINHIGVLSAMDAVHADLPELAAVLENIHDMLSEAASDPHTR